MLHLNIHLLPELLQELIRALGQDAALRLVDLRGGAHLVVPKRVSLDHPLAELLGPRMFADLVEAFAGETLQMPKNDSVMQQVRHQRVRELRALGMTHSEIAIKTHYSRRWVIEILADEERELMQLGMFSAEGEVIVDEGQNQTQNQGPTAHDPFGMARASKPLPPDHV